MDAACSQRRQTGAPAKARVQQGETTRHNPVNTDVAEEVNVRKELVVKGKSLTGTSDLTLLAPLIPGLVPSLDAITYKTRAKRLMKTLQGGRVSLHEYSAYRPISDAVERVAMIHSFRVAVLEPEDKVMLAVTFDGTWESYIRVLWQKVGTLLDIIFCNTQGYELSTSSFEAWTAWVRRVQVETSFFYNTHGLTVDDVAYLREEERIHRRLPQPGAPQDLEAVRHSFRNAETIAWDAIYQPDAVDTTDAGFETLRQGLQSLAVLFRMTDSYLPGTDDGEVLRRAARDLLQEFTPLLNDLPRNIADKMKERFGRQLDWLAENPAARREPPQLPGSDVDFGQLSHVQGGILRPYQGLNHGCLVLIAFDNRAAAADLLAHLATRVTKEGQQAQPALTVNVALTYEGLRACGLSEAQLELFPQEFREGMEARAGMLGDVRTNHPRRWRHPVDNWGRAATGTRIEMSAVHLVVQLRVANEDTDRDPTQPGHPLHAAIQDIVNDPDTLRSRPGIRVLSVQGMKRLHKDDDPAKPIEEHFGFADGGSDPVFDEANAGSVYPNRVHLGEFLLCRANEADEAQAPATPQEKERHAWLRDGSFLVVRKLSQHVERLHNLLVAAQKNTGLDRELILAKMMGRDREGVPQADPATHNDFHYGDDTDGAKCPFHAHIRRANPRSPEPGHAPDAGPPLPAGGRRPRIMRRSMSYGPPRRDLVDAVEEAEADGEERGLVFMAYNASISEQFEVIQRWITGGNSSGGHSRQSDPFLGVPDWDEKRTYRFEANGAVHRIALDAGPGFRAEPEPLVRLEWGMYLFTPSIPALDKLRGVAAAAATITAPWSADEGEAIVQDLLRLERQHGAPAAIPAWKAVLEDPEAQEKYRSAGVWAAIRKNHGGALRTAYAVLVADRALVMEVLGDQQGQYSVSGYRERMPASIGEIYLGLDDGPEYKRQSGKANEAISAIGQQEAFELTYRFTRDALDKFIAAENEVSRIRRLRTWELNLDAKEVVDQVLARICQEWFGLSTDREDATLRPGSWRWDWKEGDPSVYPAHFTAPSRYIFQPRPGDEVRDYGERIGAALTAAIARFIAPYRASNTVPKDPNGADARIAKAILGAFPGTQSDDLTARTFSGVLMGFLPTVDGNVRLSLNEWLRDGTFWSLRAAWAASEVPATFDRAKALLQQPLVRAMQLRPSPELVWRRATRDGSHVGGVELRAGDRVVASLVSATQQCLESGSTDISPVFGGNRSSTPHPTHACPGYQAGMGVLLGMLAGLLDVKETMRPSPAPLAFTFEGPTSGL